jgi:hypothetical protein
MTTLELQRALLAHYNLAKQRVQEAEGFSDAKRITKEMFVLTGICCCAYLAFDTDVYSENWVNKDAKDGDRYWGETPSTATTKEQIIERLQLRIDILTKEINNHE